MSAPPLPYGIHDLDPRMVTDPGPPKMTRCFVKGCKEFLRRPGQRDPGEACPAHGIRCHGSRTYSYVDVRRNVIVDPELLATRIVGHPFKYDSKFLGHERSEDTLSWNVFRSLQKAGCLARVAKLLIGEDHTDEPDLYLWGIRLTEDSFDPWDLLVEARERFESDLPVRRPLTEPDIALHLAGRYLLLIEAKFGSANPVYKQGPRKSRQDLTFDELLDIYQDARLGALDRDLARTRSQIHYQFWRNMIFAEWMAKEEAKGARAYHLNLVREGHEEDAAQEFAGLVVAGFEERFRRATWEGIYRVVTGGGGPPLHNLCKYMETKTERLERAFSLP